MAGSAATFARRLAAQAEAVCRHYLPAGRRQGRYWIVGDVENSPGRSLYVRLVGPETGKRAAGRWTDASTGEHGDLLDLIAAREHLPLRDALAEARRFLRDPPMPPAQPIVPAPANSSLAARRLFAAAKPLGGTIGATYLRGRGIARLPSAGTVRFHPRCYRRPDPDDAVQAAAWPALVAAVTDSAGSIMAVQRTWLARDGSAKAPVASPRRALGPVCGHGVRLGPSAAVMAVGEGLETMLSLRTCLPAMPMIAAGSASHLAALNLPPGLVRLYIAMDPDSAGRTAATRLIARATNAGIDTHRLTPQYGDWNDDLMALGLGVMRHTVVAQIHRDDVAQFASVAPDLR